MRNLLLLYILAGIAPPSPSSIRRAVASRKENHNSYLILVILCSHTNSQQDNENFHAIDAF